MNSKFIKQFLTIVCLCMMVAIGNAQTIIQMEEYGGVYRIPCKVNGAKMKLIFDTGADKVCLSLSMADYLWDNDYITEEDIVGSGKSTVADGSIVNHIKVILRDIEIQGIHLRNVEAVVMDGQDAPLLLGQSAIKKLGTYSISGNKLIIDIEDSPNNVFQLSEKCKELYDFLIQEGYNLGGYDIFCRNLSNETKRKRFYENITEDGYDLGDYGHFCNAIGIGGYRVRNLSQQEVDSIAELANDAYRNDYYSIAVEQYEILYRNGFLTSYGKESYANCMESLGNYSDALEMYHSIQNEIEKEHPDERVFLYYHMAECCFKLKNYNNAIRYYEKARFYTPLKWEGVGFVSMFSIVESYKEMGNYVMVGNVVDNYTFAYLKEKGYKRTDCWEHNKKDEILGWLYFMRSHSFDEDDFEEKYHEIKYYAILAAAWGHESSIDLCNSWKLNYWDKSNIYKYK